MNFYFNIDENMCADEQWVANYLSEEHPEYSVEEHIEELHSCREWCGWYDCRVCDTIYNAMR